MRLILAATAAALLLAGPRAARADWACHAREQAGPHILARLDMNLLSDGTREPLAFEIAWQPEPGPDVFQQMSWVAIPPEATRLWKPDSIRFSIATPRTDRSGLLVLDSEGRQRVEQPARGLASPLGHATWIEIEDATLLARLWRQGPWMAEHRDRRSRLLGRQALLLPPAEEAQTLFVRLRGRIERDAADPATRCREIPQPEDPL